MNMKLSKVIQHIALYLVSFLFIIPLLWLIMLSFKTNSSILLYPSQLPKSWALTNYISALNSLNIFTLYWNTFSIAFTSVAISSIITFMSSFAISHLNFKHAGIQSSIYSYFLVGIAISPFILLFPAYKLNILFGLNEKAAVIVPYIATMISFSTLLQVGFFRSIPLEIAEVAIIDGANLSQLMIRIMAPMTKPVLATIIVFNILYCWNEYPFVSIMINDSANYTLSKGVKFFQGMYSTNYAEIAAYSVMLILPELIFYALFQKHIIKGMTAGAVKG